MKKIAVVIMFFSFCGGSDETIETLTTKIDEDTTTISMTDTQSINDDCPEKWLFDTPVDLNLVTSIL